MDHEGLPLLVLAGPGTGKTTAIVETVAERITRRGIDPERVLVLTFSRKAAEELRQRITARLGRTTREPLALTFHSYAYALVRREFTLAGDEPPTLLSGPEQLLEVRRLLRGEAEDGGTRWPERLRPALGTRGFATELRDFLLRGAERGFDGRGLARLGRQQDRDDWVGESRARWSGRDRRAWDDDGWAGEDGDSAEYEARDDSTGGAEGNERLTALTGSLLLVLFAAEGITILSVHLLLTLHFFLGMLLIGPVALKACAVLYRFVRYYTGAPEYRRKGPPAPLLRLLGPLLMITSLTVLGTGVMLAIVGPSGAGTWLFLHRASFILWFGAMTVHVLAYVWRLPRLISGDLATRAGYRAQEILAGRGARWLLLTASVVTGLLLAVLTYNRTGIWFGVGH